MFREDQAAILISSRDGPAQRMLPQVRFQSSLVYVRLILMWARTAMNGAVSAYAKDYAADSNVAPGS